MKIFAIIPVYNVEPYITEFLDSLVSQDDLGVTYVLINDGSTDKSADICRKYAAIDSRFHLIEQENAGVSSARNRGLDYVVDHSDTGDRILFFDPDDYLTSNRSIALIREELKRNETDLLIYNYNTNNSLTINKINRGG